VSFLKDFFEAMMELQDKYDDLLKAHLELSDANNNLNTKCIELEALVKYYEERLRLNRAKKFGASSEKGPFAEQLSLFNEVEAFSDSVIVQTEDEEHQTTTIKRKKRRGKREEDFANLPVETIEYTIPESEAVCPVHKTPLHIMKKEIHRRLEIIPAQAKVIEEVQYSYVCRDCERNDIEATIIRAPMPLPLLHGSFASAGAVAFIMVQKYMYAMPLYRLSEALKYDNIILSRQTMCNWVLECTALYLNSIYDEIEDRLLREHDILAADETTLQVLREHGKTPQSKSYMWMFRTGADVEVPLVIYLYHASREHKHAKEFFERHENGCYVLCDGFEAYHKLPERFIPVGCWNHARTYFVDALKVIPEDKRGESLTMAAFSYFDAIFALERRFKHLTPAERFEMRLEHSKPIAEAFFEWAQGAKVLPKSLLGKAVRYALAQKAYLLNVYLDGRLEFTNNISERTIRHFVIGRKNWLFSNTPRGADTSAKIYSIIETAKENGLVPYQYLKYVLEVAPNINLSQLDILMPWSKSLPDYCRAPKVSTTAADAPSVHI
jgi:transposase